MTPSTRLINYYFDSKRASFPSYSIRAMARDLDCSHTFIHQVLKGKKKFPLKKISTLAKVLDLDIEAERTLVHYLEDEKGKALKDLSTLEESSKEFTRFRPVEKKSFRALERWYYLVVLDLSTCEDYEPSPSWIAKRLALSLEEVKDALSLLVSLGLMDEKTLKKKEYHIRFPTGRYTRDKIRQYHTQMIKKSLEQFESEMIEDRLISGITFSGSKENLAIARERLNKCMHEIASLLTEGKADEVYQLNFQLFPHTKSKR